MAISSAVSAFITSGGVCSPVMTNIYAHYVLDTWIEEQVQPRCQGKVKLFRYADDAIICCETERDAKRILEVLEKRLAKFKLKLNKDKTKVVSFSKAKAKQGIQQGTFDFLGFTFYIGRSKRGLLIPKVKTAKKRFVTKLKIDMKWMKENRNKRKLVPLWKTFCAKMRGHIQYYGVSFNFELVGKFIYESRRIFYKWINRRSQRKSMNWEKFQRFIDKHPLPAVCIKHKLF